MLFISMFYDLEYFPKIERGLMKVLHGALVVAKWYKMCGCMYLDGSTIIGHGSLASQNFHDKTKICV